LWYDLRCPESCGVIYVGFLRFLNRFFGVFAGLLLYPLKSLLVNAGFAVFILAGLLYGILSRIFGGDHSFSGRIFVLLFSPLSVAGSVALVALIAVSVASIDILRTAYHGVVTGWNKGLTRVLYNVLFKINKFNIMLSLADQAVADSNNIGAANNAVWLQEDFTSLPDVPRTAVEFQALANPEPRQGFCALTEDETILAGQLVDRDVKKLVERYTALKKTLEDLDIAMQEEKDKEGYLPNNVDDDFFWIGFETAVLVVQASSESG